MADKFNDNERDLLNVLKYNQDKSNDLINKVEDVNNNLDERINATRELLKSLNIDVSKYSNASKIKNESNINVDSGLEKTWDDVVKEVNDEGYVNTEISDVLTNKEQMQVYQKIDETNEQFSKATGLNSTDVKFLFFATVLQCLRQYLISNDKFRFDTDKGGDNFIGKFVPRKYEDILLGSVPYDAVRKAEGYKDQNTGISGANHRYMALGHDPLLGWIFGTLNIMTNTLTKNSPLLTTYIVKAHPTTGNYTQIGESVLIPEVFINGVNLAKNDYKLLAVSVIRQALHFGADAFTKMGLPIPIINTISPDLSSKLLSENFRIDVYSVSRGIMLSTLINSIISAIHGLFYDEKVDIKRDLYEVRTRKILSYSNALATSSNIIYTAITKDFTKLDVGGAVVILYRLISDYSFISKVKYEFINEILDNELRQEIEKIDEMYNELV